MQLNHDNPNFIPRWTKHNSQSDLTGPKLRINNLQIKKRLD